MKLPVGPLLAAGLDWLEGLLPLLFVLFWIASQVIGVLRKVAAPREPLVRELPRPVPPPEDAGVARAELERQIADFLKQATEGRSGRPEAAPPRRMPTPPSPGREAAAPRSKPKAPRPPQPTRPAPQLAAAPAAGPMARPLGSLADRGTDIARHVHDAFGQELRHLASDITAAPVKPALPQAAPAVDLIALLRTPATMRQLVLVREVLERPVDRW